MRPDRRPHGPSARLSALVLVGAVLFVFAGALGHGFVWDDRENVVNEARVREWSAANAVGFWTAPHLGLWIPLTYNALSAIAQVAATPPSAAFPAGLDPAWFHGANLLLHAASAVLVLLLLRRLTGSAWGAALGAALFALHPLQVEPVAWVTGIKDLLSTVLALAALVVYLGPSAAAGRPWLAWTGATVLYALALSAKPGVVTLPAIAWVLQVFVQRRPPLRGAAVLGLWLALALAVTLINDAEQHAIAMAPASPLWARPLIAADALAFYLGKLVWPAGLGPMYGRTPDAVRESGALFWTWLAPVTLGAVAALSPARAVLLPALAVSVLALLPALGLQPFRFQLYSTVADRYCYLALLGPALAVAGWSALGRSPRARAAAAAALVVLAGLSWRQTAAWKDNLSLWTRAVDVQPENALAQHNLGHFLAREGRSDEAELHLRKALALSPRYANALNSLGNVLLDRGDARAAIPYYRDALALEPDDGRVSFNLANAYSSLGDWDAAATHFLTAMAVTPRYKDDPRAQYGLGVARLEQGQLQDAALHLSAAVRLDPGFADARARLDDALLRLGGPDQPRASR